MRSFFPCGAEKVVHARNGQASAPVVRKKSCTPENEHFREAGGCRGECDRFDWVSRSLQRIEKRRSLDTKPRSAAPPDATLPFSRREAIDTATLNPQAARFVKRYS